ncbi:hypothetical protein [Actinotalea sp. K2]|uniref:hypothetical protein n=1 Tax=Actinotalea sp. K2 TaxID=2939438 RepID=UPI002017805C|nr:hypothetical protein [Actinotalea sp. K2]MCL3861839.1 hypothetical protein [Actinotalea sp. K2]
MSEHDLTDRQPVTGTHPPTSGVLLFVMCAVLLVGGFYLMALSVEIDSGLLFLVGLGVSSLGFLLPLQITPS